MVKAAAAPLDTRSSNEIEDDYYEYMTAEISPSKQVYESQMRKPKRTKLMAGAVQPSRQFSAQEESKDGREGDFSSDDLERDETSPQFAGPQNIG